MAALTATDLVRAAAIIRSCVMLTPDLTDHRVAELCELADRLNVAAEAIRTQK